MERKINFEDPMQVSFFDSELGEWVGGIAYGTEIICGDTGELIDIDEIYESAPDTEDPIRVHDDWVDVSDAIMGAELFEEV